MSSYAGRKRVVFSGRSQIPPAMFIKEEIVDIFYLSLLALAILDKNSNWESWTDQDTISSLTYVSLFAIDWLQTRTLAQNNWDDGYHEAYPFLGIAPSVSSIDTYSLAAIGLNTVKARLLPNPYRRIWQTHLIISEGETITKSHSIGVRISLKF